VEEHLWVSAPHLVEPIRTSLLMTRQGFVFPSGPLLKFPVNKSKKLVHHRPIERPIVVPPPADNGVVLLRQFGKRSRRLSMQPPFTHSLPHPLHGLVARPRLTCSRPVLERRQKQRQQQKQPHRCPEVDGSLHIREMAKLPLVETLRHRPEFRGADATATSNRRLRSSN